MIGKQQVVIGAQELLAGASTSDYAADAGFGASSYGITPFARKGTIKATKTPTDASTNLDSNLIASCEDYQTAGAVNGRILLGATGKIYAYQNGGTSVTLEITGAATTKYEFGKSDMVSFASHLWISLTTDLAKLETGATTTWAYDEDWWTATKSEAAFQAYDPHPLLVYENLLWVADSNKLHYVDTSLNVTNDALLLPDDEHIYALGIDSGTGLMMISVEKTVNLGGIINTRHIVYLYDGFSAKARRKIFVDATVFAFYNVGGTVYVGYGNAVGAWNGSGITFLRTLRNVVVTTATIGDMPWKHHFSNIRNILLVVDGADVLGYGEVVPNAKAWFPLVRNPVDTAHLGIAVALTEDNIGIGFPTNKWYFASITATAAGTGRLYTNQILFPRPVYVRNVRVVTTGVFGTGGALTAGVGEMICAASNGGGDNTYAPSVKTFISPVSGSFRYLFDFVFNLKCQVFQGYVNMDTQGFGIVAIIIYYDVAE